MAKGEREKVVLMLDDEPEYLQWVEEFLKSKGLQAKFVTTLADGLRALATRDFRLFLVDMNVPSGNAIEPAIAQKHPMVVKYPGLVLAIEARNMGYGAHSVIAYTVHDDDAAAVELDRLHCRYVLKGRPEALKKVVMSSLEPPPIKGHAKIAKAVPRSRRRS